MQSNPLCSPRIHLVLNRGFDFKYCSDPGAIEMIIVKSPSMPLLGAGGGYWGIPLTGALLVLEYPHTHCDCGDFRYCSDPGAIEMIIVKSPSMPLLGAGGGYWGILLTGALILL